MSSLLNRKPRPAQYIENSHDHALRDGNAFFMDFHADGLAVDGEVLVRFVTGDKAIVFENAVISMTEEQLLIEVFEDSVFSTAGVLNDTYAKRMNRIKTRETEIQFYDGAVASDEGVRFMHQVVRGVASQSTTKPGLGSSTDSATRVLKPNTEHIMKMTNKSAGPIDVEAQFFYREVDARMYQ